ncbi:hypothetical protein BD410DRAFT_831434 [Rickenella mellea]|uniref:F-box domain-containing protein n=1 Tax=Rickenella mellea TaxID=50990 RepID=A0A4Y7PQ02_9AGAM|nr:hypothetical protein BD410DRAFT_831434 [Rickenella mellea]
MSVTTGSVARRASITDIPTEILCAVLERSRGVDHPAVVAAQVCQRWRAVASDMPHVWSHIHSSFPTKLIIGMLHRSRSLPLYIVIDFSKSNFKPSGNGIHYDETVAMIFQHLPRIRELRIFMDDGTPFHHCHTVLDVPAGMLAVLQISITNPSEPLTLGENFLGGVHNPALKTLYLDRITPRWDSPIFQNLTSLSIKFDYSGLDNDVSTCQIVDVLGRCPDLENLTLKVCPMLLELPEPTLRVNLSRLRRLYLNINKIEDYNALMSIMELPTDLHCTLIFPSQSFYYDPLPIVWPRRLTPSSICESLSCYVGSDQLKIEASVYPDVGLPSVTDIVMHLGPYEDTEDVESWVASKSEQDTLPQCIDYLAEIISHPYFTSASTFEITLDPNFRFCDVDMDITTELKNLLTTMRNVDALRVSVNPEIITPFLHTAEHWLPTFTNLRYLRINLDLNETALESLIKCLSIRSERALQISELRVVGENRLPTVRKGALLEFADLVLFEES